MKIFKYFNEYRVEHNLKPLRFDSRVLSATNHHCEYLRNNGYPYNYILANPHLEVGLVEMTDRVKEYGVTKLISAGECIQYTFLTFKGTHDEMLRSAISSWDESPSHKRIMLLSEMDIGAISVIEVEGGFIMVLNVVDVGN